MPVCTVTRAKAAVDVSASSFRSPTPRHLLCNMQTTSYLSLIFVTHGSWPQPVKPPSFRFQSGPSYTRNDQAPRADDLRRLQQTRPGCCSQGQQAFHSSPKCGNCQYCSDRSTKRKRVNTLCVQCNAFFCVSERSYLAHPHLWPTGQ